MTDELGVRVLAVYNELHTIVDKDPKTPLGAPTIKILRYLVAEAKNLGTEAKLCDAILEALSGSHTATIPAADAFVIAGQLKKLVGLD